MMYLSLGIEKGVLELCVRGVCVGGEGVLFYLFKMTFKHFCFL